MQFYLIFLINSTLIMMD